MTKIFDLVPSWIYALAIAAVLALLGVQTLRVGSLKTDAAEHALADSDGQRMAMLAQREESDRRQSAIDTETQNAQHKIAALETDLGAARTAGSRLLDAANAAARRARPSPDAAPASPSEPGQDPLDLLLYVLGRADDTAGELAEYADRLRIAGTTCERSYDALTKPK